MIGVVCHEHVGPPRTWSQEEQSFAGSIGDLASLAIASNQRRKDERERRKLELKVQQAQKLESLGVLAGGIAHDFNNLLVGVLGNAGLALDELPRGSAVRECIEDVQTAAKRAADLCHQLLAYSGKGKFVIGPVDVNELVREMGHLLELSLSKKAVLRYDLADDLPAVEADATQIRQVVMNLITNASEALGDASGVVAISTGTVACDREYLDHCHLGDHLAESTYVYLEVSDTGSGMDESTVHRIFDPFYTSKFTGRGLGLAAVQGIVRGHRGAVRIDTTPGEGTRFRVLLPRIAPGAHRVEEASPSTDEWRGEGTILLVDDDEAVRRVSRRMLERVGFAVVTAADGIEGIELFERHGARVVAVVLDVVMPRMGGEETFRELRRRRADVPILLCSGFSEPEALRSLGGDGRTGFVKKPYVAAQLVEKLRETMQAGTSA